MKIKENFKSMVVCTGWCLTGCVSGVVVVMAGKIILGIVKSGLFSS